MGANLYLTSNQGHFLPLLWLTHFPDFFWHNHALHTFHFVRVSFWLDKDIIYLFSRIFRGKNGRMEQGVCKEGRAHFSVVENWLRPCPPPPPKKSLGTKKGYHQWGRRLEGLPNTAARLAGWRRVNRQVWFCMWWTGRTACFFRTVPAALTGAALLWADGIF